MAAAVDLARPLVLGQWPIDAAQRFAVLVAYCVVSFAIALILTRRRLRS